MIHALSNTIRRLVLTQAFKTLALRKPTLPPLEPKTDPDQGDPDCWMFASEPSVKTVTAAFSGEMSRLGDTLGRLRALVGRVSAEAPVPVLHNLVPVTAQAVWSDTVLFDGEPEAITDDMSMAISGGADFLFDDGFETTDTIPQFVLQAGLQLPLPEDAYALAA